MGRKPKNEESIKAKDEAVETYEKCIAQARDGELKSASQNLYDDAWKILTRSPKPPEDCRKILRGRQLGETGRAILAKTAYELLTLCAVRPAYPPLRLVDAFRLILGIEPSDIGNDYDRAALAASYPSFDDVTKAELAAVAPGKYSQMPVDRRDIARLVENPEFLKQVEDIKAERSPEARRREDAVRARTMRRDARYAGLLDVVAKASREPAIADAEKPDEPEAKGYFIPPLHELMERAREIRTAMRAKKAAPDPEIVPATMPDTQDGADSAAPPPVEVKVETPALPAETQTTTHVEKDVAGGTDATSTA